MLALDCSIRSNEVGAPVIHVRLLSDSELLCLGFASIFSRSEDIEFAYGCSSILNCEDISCETQPGVIIIDRQSSNLPQASELKSFVGALRKRCSDTAIIFVTDTTNRVRHEFALQLGIRGYCLRSITAAELIEAVHTVARGETYIHDAYAEQAANSAFDLGGIQGKLSKRHMEVLRLILLGFSNSEIAELLYISVPTVKAHTKAILRVLNARDRTQLVSQVFQGLLQTAERQSHTCLDDNLLQ